MSAEKHKKSLMLPITVCVLLIAGIIAYMTAKDMLQNVSWFSRMAENKDNKYKVVIDSGHGGMDPGKVGINGALEKEINLSIAIMLKEALEAEGCEVVMVRETDTGLYSESDSNKKVSDLRKRVEIMNTEKPDVIVSIHQNSFTNENSKGAQVFYQTTSENGKRFAEIMQKQLIEDLDNNNHRVAKPNSDYYILKNSVGTAIIVECGFLSNSEEAQLLIDSDYQKKIALSIAKGTMAYLEDKSVQTN